MRGMKEDKLVKVKENGKIVILGVGNLLCQDEGVGVHLIEKLREEELPPQVDLIDGGTSSFDILPFLEESKKLIVVDAVYGGEKPGTIYRFRPEDINDSPDDQFSLHEINFLDALRIERLRGNKLKNTIIIGIEPDQTETGTDLTPKIKEKIPQIMDLVKEEILIETLKCKCEDNDK